MKNEERIIKKLLEHDEKLDQMVTKDKFQSFRHEVLTGQEQMVTILKRLDEERIFTAEWVKRIELKVEKQEKELEKQKEEIRKIKLKLKVT